MTSGHHQRTLLEYETALQHLLALLTVKLSATHSQGLTTRPSSHCAKSHTANEHRNNDNSPGARIWPGSPTKVVTRAQLDERCVIPTPVRCVNEHSRRVKLLSRCKYGLSEQSVCSQCLPLTDKSQIRAGGVLSISRSRETSMQLQQYTEALKAVRARLNDHRQSAVAALPDELTLDPQPLTAFGSPQSTAVSRDSTPGGGGGGGSLNQRFAAASGSAASSRSLTPAAATAVDPEVRLRASPELDSVMQALKAELEQNRAKLAAEQAARTVAEAKLSALSPQHQKAPSGGSPPPVSPTDSLAALWGSGMPSFGWGTG